MALEAKGSNPFIHPITVRYIFNGLSPSGKAQDFDSCITLVRIQLAQFLTENTNEYGRVAQSVEHLTFNQVVRGSNPRTLIKNERENVEESMFSLFFYRKEV